MIIKMISIVKLIVEIKQRAFWRVIRGLRVYAGSGIWDNIGSAFSNVACAFCSVSSSTD